MYTTQPVRRSNQHTPHHNQPRTERANQHTPHHNQPRTERANQHTPHHNQPRTERANQHTTPHHNQPRTGRVKHQSEFNSTLNSTIYFTPEPAVQHLKLDNFCRVLSDEFPREKYYRRKKEVKNSLHWGQRKLLISEIEFLNMFYANGPHDKDVYLIYAGAAPGTHFIILAQFFPRVNFILYDPREFDPALIDFAKTAKITIRQQYFTDTDARQLSELDGTILFVSDIRTANTGTMPQLEIERHVVADHAMQRGWYHILKPEMAMLKFRLPWDDGTTRYIDGDIYFQCYAPLSSTETRLLIKGYTTSEKLYDNRKYEEQLFYFNKHCREFEYKNMLEHIPFKDRGGLNNKYDSVCEISVLSDLCSQLDDKEKKIIELSEQISNYLSSFRTLSSDQPLNTANKKIFQKAIDMGLIHKMKPTVSNYNKFVLPIYDLLDPSKIA